jgi:type II secretory ATPase GspE/PulE/Tfp pilus assembly ATPase PilB-like protein
VDGEVQDLLKFPSDFDQHKDKVISRIKMMANLDVSEKRMPQDGKFKAQMGTKHVDCRVNVCPTVDGEKAVIRVLSKDRLNVSLTNIGLSNYSLKLTSQMLAKPHGLVLVTGPTGSGKTSTLYAALNYLWKPTKSVVTVEDPVEYEVDDYSQSQVNNEIGLTFAEVLRAMLRQAPDIILVGEIRDSETAKIACEAAMTGHQVLSTLHANDSPSSVLRLTEIGVDNFLVASVFVGVVAQRLVRKVCARCRKKVGLTKEMQEFAKRYKLQTNFVYHHNGCNACMGSGYIGRTGIHEILVNSPGISEVISRKGTPFDILSEARKKGFVSLKEDAMLKVFQGITDMEQVAKVTGV